MSERQTVAHRRRDGAVWTVVRVALAPLRFVWRHRVATAVSAAALYAAYRFVRSRVVAASVEFHANALQRVKMETYFEEVQETCRRSVVGLLPVVRERLVAAVDVPLDQMRQSMAATKEEKLLIWNTSKINIFTRTIAAVYAVCLLSLFQRTQCNIVGRYLFVDRAAAAARQQPSGSNALGAFEPEPEPTLSAAIKTEYLCAIDHPLTAGIDRLAATVRVAAEEVLAAYALQHHCTADDCIRIVQGIRDRVELRQTDAEQREIVTAGFVEFLLRQERDEGAVGAAKLRALMDQTRDVFDSPAFRHLLFRCFQAAFGQLHALLRAELDDGGEPGGGLTMAKLMPRVGRQLEAVVEARPGANDFLRSLEAVRDVTAFSFDVFSHFDA